MPARGGEGGGGEGRGREGGGEGRGGEGRASRTGQSHDHSQEVSTGPSMHD